jgi:TatD DNase family protein
MIIHGFSKKEQLAKQLLIMGFIFRLKNIAQSRIGISFTSIPIDFSWKRIPSKKHREVYTLAAKYKNITVTEIQKK